MEYIYTALLLHKAGKEVTEDTVKKVLQAAGVEVDDARVKALVAALEGVDIEDAIQNAAPVAPAPAGGAPAPADGEDAGGAEEEKKEKKEDEKKPEEAAAGLGSLFG